MNKKCFVLPPVRPVGIRCIRFFKDQHKELMHLQEEGVSADLREEAGQESVLVLTQSLFVLLRNSHKWILKNTGNAQNRANNNNNNALLYIRIE